MINANFRHALATIAYLALFMVLLMFLMEATISNTAQIGQHKSGRGSDMKEEPATFFASAAITVFLTGCIVIAHDLSPGFKEFLASLTGHHRTSVSLITIILFVFFLGILVGSESAKSLLEQVISGCGPLL